MSSNGHKGSLSPLVSCKYFDISITLSFTFCSPFFFENFAHLETMCWMQMWCINLPVVLSVEISRRKVLKHKRRNSSNRGGSCQTIWVDCLNARVWKCACICFIKHCMSYKCMLYLLKIIVKWSQIFNMLFYFLPALLSFLPSRKSKRRAIPSFVLGDVMWPWMVWSPTRPTCFRSELGRLLDMEPAAPAFSLKPALTVSSAQTCVFFLVCFQKHSQYIVYYNKW